MTRSAFSKDYRTYGEWLKAQPRESRYAKEIIKKHNLAPYKTLNQLRNASLASLDISKRPITELTTEQQHKRQIAVQVLNRVRKGETFKEAVQKEYKFFLGLDNPSNHAVRTIRKHLGEYMHKEGGKLRALHTDNLQTYMYLYSREDGRIKIIVGDYETRQLIGRYMNDTRHALEGNLTILEKYKRATVMDASGNVYKLETNAKVIETELNKLADPADGYEIYAH